MFASTQHSLRKDGRKVEFRMDELLVASKVLISEDIDQEEVNHMNRSQALQTESVRVQS